MMQGQQPVIRQADQQILQQQQPTSIVIKMTDGIQQITPVGKCKMMWSFGNIIGI